MKNNRLIRYKNLKVHKYQINRFIKTFSNFINSGHYLSGPHVENFEKVIAKYCNKSNCIGVSSGTNALYLALKAHNIGKGDEVICPAISWIATANAISMTGAKPVFVDVKYNQTISPDAIKNAITKKTSAIMMVHFTGILCDFQKIIKIAKLHKLLLIEDAAQAFGAKYKGYIAGGLSDVSTFSFNPMKVLQGFGDAGCVLTNSNIIRSKVQRMRHLGVDIKNREKSLSVELNSKIDELQAALILVSLKGLQKEINYRKKLINNYISELNKFVMYCDHDVQRSSCYDYQILVRERSKLKKFLQERNIETRIKHPILMSNQPIYKNAKKLNLKVAKIVCAHSLSLPLHKHLSFSEQEYVISSIKKFYK